MRLFSHPQTRQLKAISRNCKSDFSVKFEAVCKRTAIASDAFFASAKVIRFGVAPNGWPQYAPVSLILAVLFLSGCADLHAEKSGVQRNRGQMNIRDLSQLVNTKESAWPMIQAWVKDAKNQVEVLPPTDPARSRALLATQVTTRSPMGSIIYETGGLLIDHGWLRILGSGHPKLPRTLPDWNKSVGNDFTSKAPPFLLVADDAIGGFFAIDGGAFGKPGNVFNFAPDSLRWEDTGKSYTDFIDFCFNGDLEKFYEGLRWQGWQADLKQLPGDKGFMIYPFLFAAGPPIDARQRKPVPLSELYGLFVEKANAAQSKKPTF